MYWLLVCLTLRAGSSAEQADLDLVPAVSGYRQALRLKEWMDALRTTSEQDGG